MSAQAARLLERFSSTSERLSAKSSSTLFGCLGGLGGITSAYLISIFATVSLPALGVLLASTGLISGVLLHRGRRRFALERRIEENRLAANEILSRLKSLPKSTPPEVREELWLAYRSLTGGFHSQVTRALEGTKGHESPSPRLLLPPAASDEAPEETTEEK
ncbi:MAG: hypothetical protein ACREEM_32390 [Blastocatellia bacterium]